MTKAKKQTEAKIEMPPAQIITQEQAVLRVLAEIQARLIRIEEKLNE